MAIVVTKHGDQVRDADCDKCGCGFIYCLSDAAPDDQGLTTRVECPECLQWVPVVWAISRRDNVLLKAVKEGTP